LRALCSAIDGNDVQGEVIGGEDFDPTTGPCDLDAKFTVRCDDGALFQVHGWLVDVTVVEPRRTSIM
jgi:hypothetical protein